MPDRNTEYLYYQTLIGAWPLPVERAQAYMLKAAREAKQQTTWVANNQEFEGALHSFIERTLAHAPFVREVQQFVERVKDAGRVNSLAQTLMKHTAPGVPDLYQGTELWDLSLVDPDNRRPVDYEERRRLLSELMAMRGDDVAAQVMARAEEGLPKMWTIHQALRLRRERPEWFGAEAGYTPLAVDGAKRDHVIAYLRGDARGDGGAEVDGEAAGNVEGHDGAAAGGAVAKSSDWGCAGGRAGCRSRNAEGLSCGAAGA